MPRRALLPHVFTLTPPKRGGLAFCGTFRISPFGETPVVNRRGTLCCPDFPLADGEPPQAVEWTKLQGEQRRANGEGCPAPRPFFAPAPSPLNKSSFP
jgi:hypothetical protein